MFLSQRAAAPSLSPDAKEEAEALVRQASEQPLTDGGLVTDHLLTEALRRDPANHAARTLRERLYQMFVPRWHFPMLGDTRRNHAYARAIAARVRPGDIVLDIGTGAGLTAMLAARAGAGHVYTCEMQPMIAEAARHVIATNGLSEKITVICKPSQALELGVDLPERADVVISEIVDSVLLGEGALGALAHAMRELAKPGARAIPERGRLMAQPVESAGLLDLWRPARAEGFDLSAFHRFASVAQLTPNDFIATAPRALGEPVRLFDFDFTRPDTDPDRRDVALPCSEDGTAHAVLVSFRMALSPGIHLSNGIHATGHWGRIAVLCDRPEAVTPGDVLPVTAQHDAAQLSLCIHPVSRAAQESLQPLPVNGLTAGTITLCQNAP
ncbi:50S ribosomal protein L11 methyltransferase [Pacificoceanicola onchidii]|uniref:50S ribosomal protein L11 methyltransferase n=1 Tax=Pacificoceanicola onchidii TaxID=2562685 RepID=UPI001F10917A|nr:50S ribosomal protein L11 methyltransferase [Pacificoceanicola onchidii]